MTKIVLTYGTYDLFHIGHVRLLQRARELGDKLYVGISTDSFNAIKGKASVMPYEHRAGIVSALTCVDGVFPENGWDQKADDIRRLGASVLVMGDDWKGKFDDFGTLCEVTYLPRTKGISSTQIKTALAAFRGEKIDELKKGLDALHDIIEQLNI